MATPENKKGKKKSSVESSVAEIEWNLKNEVFIENKEIGLNLDEFEEIDEERLAPEVPEVKDNPSEVVMAEDLDSDWSEEEVAEARELSEQSMNADSLYEEPSFLPESREDDVQFEETEELEDESKDPRADLSGTELESFDSAAIEETEFVEMERLQSIIESLLFASDRPVSLASIKAIFKGTNIRTDHIRKTIHILAVEYASGTRGVTLEEVPGGYQLRTKLDNMKFLRRTLKARPFKLSGPALEVLAIVAYKQPVVKAEIDQIRGVESGHLLRAIMEKGLVNFAGKSDLPGKPMFYSTTKKFLEVFGLRNLKELPSLSEIDELLPEGIGDEETEKKTTLDMITDSLSQQAGATYSQGEEELLNISSQLENIQTSSEFFEQEKRKELERKNVEKAERLRASLEGGTALSTRDRNWLSRYEQAIAEGRKFEDEEVSQERTGKATSDVENKASDVHQNDHDEEVSPEEFSEEIEDDLHSEEFLNDSSKDDLVDSQEDDENEI